MTHHLVTGGAGLIGSHLVDRLLLQGDHVTVVDNFSTGSKGNLWHTMSNLTVLEQCVTEYIDGNYDYIWHLACPASPPAYQKDPLQTLDTCYIGTSNVLRKAAASGAKLLFTSTSEIYGDPLQHPQSEDYHGNVNTIGPRACYDEGKRVAESLVYNYWLQQDSYVRIARIFNTYGPRMSPSDGRVISNFITQSLNGQPHTIYGDGSVTRSFCFVTDTVDALIRIMHSKGSIVYNVGNPDEITLLQLSSLVHAALGVNPQVIVKPRPTDDPVRRKPDISRIQHDLSWSPTISLSEGLQLTISYFKHALQPA